MDMERRMTATLDQVARAAGVSRATVSRVVNGTRNVDPTIAAAVRAAIEDIGYVPNRAARSLRTRRLGTVACAVSTADLVAADAPRLPRSLADPFVARIVGAALVRLQEKEERLELIFVEDRGARDWLVRRLVHRDVDGLLVITMHTEDPLPELVAQTGQPAVLIGRLAAPVNLTSVDVDHRLGAGLVADLLVRRGCRRVATIAGPEKGPGAEERLGGFLDAMATLGVLDVPVQHGDFSVAAGESAMEQLLSTHPDVDGVFAANDLMAHGAVLALREHGRSVPDDVAVVGFDDSSMATDTRPMLTTIRQPLEAMAEEMVRLLLEQIEQPGALTRTVVLAPELVRRGSA